MILKKKRIFVIMGIVISMVLILFISTIYFIYHGYSFSRSRQIAGRTYTITAYSRSQNRNSISLEFGSFSGSKQYSMRIGESDNLYITSAVNLGEVTITVYDNNNVIIGRIDNLDTNYQMDVSNVSTSRIHIVLSGNFSGKVDFKLG